MADFTSELLAFTDQINAMSDLSIDEKEQIANEGARVFQDDLKRTVKARHYRIRKTGRNPHLANSIRVRKGNRDGQRYGSVTVGWNNNKAHIANMIEGGTRVAMVKRSPRTKDGTPGRKYRLEKGGQVAVRRDPFVSEVQSSSETNQKMIDKMSDAYQEVIKKRTR